MRQLRDEAGVDWVVYAVDPAASERRSAECLPESYRAGWLCFESATEKRRLTPLPPGWESLPVEKLTGLLSDAVLVQRAPKYSQ